jgi:hypothetical protein
MDLLPLKRRLLGSGFLTIGADLDYSGAATISGGNLALLIYWKIGDLVQSHIRTLSNDFEREGPLCFKISCQKPPQSGKDHSKIAGNSNSAAILPCLKAQRVLRALAEFAPVANY